MNAIRLVHVTTVDLTVRFLLLDHLLHQQRAGFQVSAVCAEGPWTEQVRDAGVPVHAADLRRGLSPLADLGALVALVRLFRKLRPQLVHTHTPKANLLGRMAARAAGVPVVVATEHGIFYGSGGLSRPLWTGVTRLGAGLSDAVYVMNQEDLATARSGAVGSPDKYVFLPGGLGVDLERFKPSTSEARSTARAALRLPPDAQVAGMVGFPRMDPTKGHSVFLEAARRVRSRLPAIQFLVVGTDDAAREPAIRALPPELAGAVTFAGQRTDMTAVYPAMDLLCLPSRREGLPVVLMEAAAMGLPAVASDIRGCRDVIVHGETGLLAPPVDAEALAVAMVSILSDSTMAAVMGAAARRRAVDLYDQRQVWAQMDAEYRRLLNARGIQWL